MQLLRFFKVTELPSDPKPNALYFLKTGNKVDLYITDTTGGIYNVDEDATSVRELSKALVIEKPTDTENISFFYTDVAITINKLVAVLKGIAPSITWSIVHSTDRSLAGNEVITGGVTTTNTTTGNVITTFDDATIPANSFIWFISTATSGTISEFNVSIIYTKDLI
jgi:hypothetical protein